MKFKTRNIDNAIIIKMLVTNFDAEVSKDFKAICKDDNLILDMSDVTYIDSSGCGVIFSCYKKLRKSGKKLKIFGTSNAVRKLFKMIGLNRIIEIDITEEQAIDSIKPNVN